MEESSLPQVPLLEADQKLLRKLLLKTPLKGSVAKYSMLLENGYSLSQIQANKKTLEKELGTSLRDGERIYRWALTGDLSGMSQSNPRDVLNTKSALAHLESEATTAHERALIASLVANVERFEKGLSNDQREDVTKGLSERLLQRVPNFSGVYAYSFQVWLDHPDDSANGLFRMKIGCGGNIRSRLHEQIASAKTSLPQPLLPLRAYHFPVGHERRAESSIHTALKTLGHRNPDYKRIETGVEWFSSSLTMLDSIATSTSEFKELVRLWTPSLEK